MSDTRATDLHEQRSDHAVFLRIGRADGSPKFPFLSNVLGNLFAKQERSRSEVLRNVRTSAMPKVLRVREIKVQIG